MEDILKKLCSVNKEDFDSVFEEFFTQRKIEISSYIDFTDQNYYDKCKINKIEIKNGKSYDEFLDILLWKLTNYYFDWEMKEDELEYVKSELNKYRPKHWISLSDLKSEDIIFKKGDKLPDGTKAKKDMSSRQLLSHLHWDIWEFLLFFLTEGFLNSPVLFSKVQYMRSHSQDKVKWSDWIHIWFDNWFYFNFLESKIHWDFQLDEIFDSNEKLLSPSGLSQEISILHKGRNNIKRYGFIFKDWFEDFINPYRKNLINQWDLPFNLVCLLAYKCESYSKLKNWDISVENHIDNYTINRIKLILEGYKKLDTNWLLNGKHINFFLLPLCDEVELIQKFLLKIEDKNASR